MAERIWIDGLFLARRYAYCGTSRYLVNLLRELIRISEPATNGTIDVLVPPGNGAKTSTILRSASITFIPCPAMRLRKLWRTGIFLSMTGVRASDTFFFPSPLPLQFKPCRLAVTVHDIIPLLFPGQFRSVSGRLLRRSVQSSLAKADLIITDSEHSRFDLVSRCGVVGERIVVAHLGFDSMLFNCSAADPAPTQMILRHYGITRPYVLSVGAIEPRKNLVRLVRAYQLLAARQNTPEFQLVLCGRLAFGYQELLNLIGRSETRGRVVMTGPVPDKELAVLYKSAVACAMPSLYEGFGLPLLEAMACGTAVISSSSSCLPEIGGDAPVYFNPESVEEMAEAIQKVLNDSALREQMVERGLRRARLFSWEDCARKTFAALRQL